MPLGGDSNDGQPLIRQPDGRFIGVFDIMERQKLEEASMQLSVLKPGDLIAMQIIADNKEPVGYLFDVTQQEITNLNIGYGWGPDLKVSGLLTGPNIPDQFTDKDLVFAGSNFGGSLGQHGIIGTGRHPLFHVGGEGNFMLPQLAGFEVYRDGKDGLQPIDPNKLDADTREGLKSHEERLTGFNRLMEKFGFDHFDIRNFSESHDYFNEPSSPRKLCNERYFAEYRAGRATGNGLTILDKETGLWQEWKYYNFSNQDVMQVAFADLSDCVLSHVFENSRIGDESAIYRAGVGVTTFTSSSMTALNVVNYRVSDAHATDQLGIPIIGSHGPFNPSIQIFADGQVRIPIDYPLTLVDEKYPGVLGEAFKLIRLTSTKPLTLKIGNETVIIRSTEDELQKLLESTGQQI